MDATVTPLPTEETTPPVQKRYFVTLTSLSNFLELEIEACSLWHNDATTPLLF